MQVPGDGIIIIGENFNTTRSIRSSSPKVVIDNGKYGIRYEDLDGNKRVLDITRSVPEDPDKRKNFPIPHIAEACRQKDLHYVRWAIKNQELHGAHIIDLCVDALSVEPEERHDWMRWLVKTAQSITDAVVSIDSSDSETIKSGLEVHDSKKSRPALNSFNLEPNRQPLVDIARERNAILFANGSGANGMPQNAEERVNNMVQCMDLMNKGRIPMEDRFIDPLVFPIGAGPQFGRDYLDAVKTLRQLYPEVHIFGGHSNVSFGLPDRKRLNFVFVSLSILNGCDSAMIDPIMNPPQEFNDYMFACDALTGKDEYSVAYLKHHRAAVETAAQAKAAGAKTAAAKAAA